MRSWPLSQQAHSYWLQSAEISTIVNRLFADCRVERLAMPYTTEDFRRDIAQEHVQELTVEECMKGLRAKQVAVYSTALSRRKS
jgi:hypothetical protein